MGSFEEPSAKRRKTSFSDVLPVPASGQLNKSVRAAQSAVSAEPEDLRLGCFEVVEVPAPKKKERRPEAREATEAPKAKPKPPASPQVAMPNEKVLEGAENAASSAAPASTAKAASKAAEAAKLSRDKEQNERREREYFKPYIGEPCGPGNRFLVEGPLGRGSFSSVFRCSDSKGGGKEYAVKFIRDNAGLRKATEVEVKLMRRIRTKAVEKDSEGAGFLLGLANLETFMHNGHLALVFHLQRYDMRTALKRQIQEKNSGFPLKDLQRYTCNILLALRALWAIRIIHTDIKPDNLLLSLNKESVKLSDFGCAIDTQESMQASHIRRAYTSSYRAPEIILGQSFSTRADMWSAGATLFELASGHVLFPEGANNAMLFDILRTCGAFKKQFAVSGKHALKHFTTQGAFRRRRQTGNEQQLSMSQFMTPSKTVTTRLRQVVQDVLLEPFADLLAGACLVPDPAKRSSAQAALKHPFLSKPR
ncbi:prp4 [Symbiodinium natans]|uniref:Prp4 protein n=1 Tax=Symbiodinium natans TaxID=878477 RepID=A0A812UUI3_9DINO|nr:prp4 [Symbiodinium natans]